MLGVYRIHPCGERLSRETAIMKAHSEQLCRQMGIQRLEGFIHSLAEDGARWHLGN